LLERAEILFRIPEAIDMVDSQSGDAVLFQELENELMDCVEDDRVLNPDRGEVVDVEETPVVNLFGGDLPVT
jgi:hypothetical protein